MNSDDQEKIDELASDLDDLNTTVEELQANQVVPRSHALGRLKTALEQATEATDELEDLDD
jgi:outer membrane murein-binding lipoprotein Lpp